MDNINFKKVLDDGELFDQQANYEENFEKINQEVVPKITALESGKVDKVAGKGLSTNDFSNEYKEKIDTDIPAQLSDMTQDFSAQLAEIVQKVDVDIPAQFIKQNFIEGVNLFDGIFSWKWFSTSTTLIMSESDQIRSVVIPISGGVEYFIETIGYHNRFNIGVANSISVGESVSVLNNNNDSGGNEKFVFKNTENYQYLLVVLSNQFDEPEVSIKTSSELVIGGTEVLTNKPNIIGKEHLKDKSVSLEKVDFISGAIQNLWQGNYHKLYVSVSQSIVNSIDTPELRRSIIIPIENEKRYKIRTIGTHNRFVVGLANSYNNGDSVEIIKNETPSLGNEIFEFTNTSNKAYLLVTLTITSEEPLVEVVKVEPLIIGGRTVLTDEDKGSINRELFDIKETLESSLSYKEIYVFEPTSDRPPALTVDLYARYDALLANYPEYVKRNDLGADALGNRIYEYVFKSPNFNVFPNSPRNIGTIIPKPKVLVVTGIHGFERASLLAVYNFCKDICENEKGSKLSALREAVEFRIIPCAVPSSIDMDTRWNHNTTNINRNFTAGWVFDESNPYDKSGPSAASENETKILESWMAEHDDAIYYTDYHNSGYDEEITYINTNGSTEIGQKIKNSYYKFINRITGHWINNYKIPRDMVLGYQGFADNFSSSRKQASSLGIPSIALEMGWQVPVDSERFGSITNSIGTEFLGNFLIELCKEYTD